MLRPYAAGLPDLLDFSFIEGRENLIFIF